LRQETLEQKAKGVCSCSVGFRATLIAGHQIRDFGVGLSTLRTMPGKKCPAVFRDDSLCNLDYRTYLKSGVQSFLAQTSARLWHLKSPMPALGGRIWS